ncbi:MAG: mechanosensitive ion channel domain-containing protein [Terriglobales bacterium]
MSDRSTIHRHLAALLLAVLLALPLLWGQSNTTAPPAPPTAQAIIAFLNQTLSWHRHETMEQLPGDSSDILFLRDNRQLADQIVRLSFDFAKAEAELMQKQPNAAAQTAAPSGGEAARHQALTELAAKAEQQVKRTQAELETLRQKLQSAAGRQRRQLQSLAEETRSELELAQTRRDVLRNMLEFVSGANASGGGAGGLLSQIQELQRSVPTAAAANTPQAAENTTVVAPRKPEASGILPLISDLVSLTRKTRSIDESIALTEELAQTAKTLRAPIGASLRQLVQRGDELANRNSTDASTLARQKAELDSLTAQFKLSSEAVLPLVKQRILLDLYKRNLTNWRNAVRSQYTAELKGLVVRLVVLVLVLVVVIGAAELWRKALFRYVPDARRRYQLLLVRRIALWFVIAIIVAFAFATELGSLATFAGLITAGVAVALQNVILSIAGYFFLIGRYGVRVGDRVQIAGVTGEVVDIGLVRLHLMELGSGGAAAQPTGRVVVFSNSVVFQPTGAFFKQIPGTNFVWHEITLTLAPESNYRAVEERLVGAVDRVFSEYRDQIEGQRRNIEKTIGHLSVKSLGPQSRLKVTQSGLEVSIRYPVEFDSAAAIDDRITRELLDAIEREPKLKLVGSGTPNIQEVANETAAKA